MMAHFYGSISGQAGPATRIGSKRSGYTAWAQNRTGRVIVHLEHRNGQDLADILISGSTVSHINNGFVLGGGLNLSALARQADNPRVRQRLKQANKALALASAAAENLEEL